MVKANVFVDNSVQDWFVGRLPTALIRRIPQTLIEGYADAMRSGHPHIASRRRAVDRHFAVQDAWRRLGEDISDVKVVRAVASNGGGPYFALETGRTLLTMHKVDSETAAPRSAAYRAVMAGERNQPYQLMLEGLSALPPIIDVVSRNAIVENLRTEILGKFDLYIVITHGPNKEGDAPEFISALVINGQNDVLAHVDVVAEARRLSMTDVEEFKETPIAEPQQKRRHQEKKASTE